MDSESPKISPRSPMAIVALVFAFGILIHEGIGPAPFFFLAFLTVAVLLFGWVRKTPKAASLVLLLSLLGVGVMRGWVADKIPADSISHYLTATPQPIICEGMVVSDLEWIHPPNEPARRQGWFQMIRFQQEKGWIPASGRLFLKLHTYNVPVAYGDRVRLSGSIRGPRLRPSEAAPLTPPAARLRPSEAAPLPPPGSHPHGENQKFDEGNWLWVHEAVGILTISGLESIVVLDSIPNFWIRCRRGIASFRMELKQMGRSLCGPLEAAYLEAFLLGEGSGLPPEVWEAFKKVGVVHVLVVSGLHVGLMASMALIGLSLFRVPRTVRYFLVAIGLVAYCILTGGNPPILRSTLMGILLCLGTVMGRGVPALNSLGFSAILILATNPRALFDASFQLSFAAVLGLFTLSPWFLQWLQIDESVLLPKWTVQGLAASAGACLAITPIVAWHFHMFTPIAFVVNLIVIPWSSLIIVSGFLLYCVGLVSPWMAGPFAVSFGWLVYGLNQFVIWLAYLPGTSWAW